MEGKKRYVAIILFLLIGLTLFTFANPNEKDLGTKDKNKDSNESEIIDNSTEDGVLSTEESVELTTPELITIENEEQDATYDNALAAVKKAEVTLSKTDIANARDLINLITNENQKQELTERIDIIEESLEAISLVDELEQMVKDAEERKDIEDSLDYRENNQIIEKIKNLRNDDVKKNLTTRLEDLNEILDDNNPPKYDGIEDNEITNQDVSITYSDSDENADEDNDVTVKVTLNGEEIEFSDSFTEEGSYTVTLVDAAFNETQVSFTIDKTNPTANITYSPSTFTQDDVVVTIILDEKVKPVDGWTLSEDETVISKVFTENNVGTIEISDIAGNVITKVYDVSNIDREKPEVTPSYTETTIAEDSVTEFTDFPKFIVTDNSNSEVSKVLISGEVDPANIGQYELVYRFTDEAGNYTDVLVTINVTDQTAPLISGLENGAYYNTKDTHAIPTVTDKHNATLYVKTTIAGKEISTKWESGKEIVQVGTYTVYAVDENGNKSEEYTINIDPYAPKVLVLDRFENVSGAYLPIKPVILEHNLDSIIVKLDGQEIPYEKGQQLTEDGNYEMIVTDKAGNITIVKFTMDSVAPTMLVSPLTLGVVDELDLNKVNDIAGKIVLSEDAEFQLMKATKNITILEQQIPIYEYVELPEDGIIDEEGQYILIAYDKAYNLTAAKFTVDRTAPIVTGIENGKYYNTDVTINIEEANLNEVPLVGTTLYKNSLPVLDFKNGDTITEDGTYKLVAKDTAGNESDTITFIIDKTNPIIEVPVKEEILQGTEELSVVADVNDKNVDNKKLTPYVTKIVAGVETDLGLQETIDVTTNGVTYRLFYTVTDKAGNTTELTVETTVVNITYEVRFNNSVYEGTYNGAIHSVPQDAKFYMIKDGVESEVTDAVINYSSNAEMKNAGEYTITAELNGYSSTATYKIHKATISLTFPEGPLTKGTTLAQIVEGITVTGVDKFALEFKLYSIYELKEVSSVVNAGYISDRFQFLGTYKYGLVVELKEEFKNNYVLMELPVIDGLGFNGQIYSSTK